MLAVVVAGSFVRRPWLWARVAVVGIAAESASYLLKLQFDRDRPPVTYAEPEPLTSVPPTPSFPSGHATVAFACATTLALAVPRLRWPLLALAVLIAFSRVWLGVHYPLDVVAGAVLGAALAIALRWLRAIPRRSEQRPTPG